MALSFCRGMQSFFSQQKIQKAFAITGMCFFATPCIIIYVWGNLSIYVMSYMHNRSPELLGEQGTWVQTLYVIMSGVAMFPSVYMARVLGKRITALLGAAVLNIGVFGSYFTIDHSMPLLDLTLGAFVGFGAGTLFAISSKYGMEWTDEKDTGIVMSIIYNSPCVFGLAMNQFITWYINPQDKLPNVKYGHFMFFSQPDVLDHVPSVFIIMGACCLIFEFLGFLMVREAPVVFSETDSFKETTPFALKIASSSEHENDLWPQSPMKDSTLSLSSTTSSLLSSSVAVEESPPSSTYSSSSPVSSEASLDVSPLQLLRTPSFYVLLIAYATCELSFIVLSVNYKAYGQLWIHDDHFLTAVGTVFTLFTIVFKIVAGLAIDGLGHKLVIVFYFGVITIGGGFFYLAPHLSQWLYGGLVVVLLAFSSTAFLVHCMTCVKMFGRTYAVENMGVLNFATIVSNMAAFSIVQFLMDWGGWLALFSASAILNGFVFLLVTFGIPS